MTQRERGGLFTLGEAIEAFLKTSGLDAHRRDGRIFRAWSEGLDEGLASRSRPVRFRAGELIVEVQSAAHLHELKNFTGEGYRQLANGRLGAEVIRRVSFKLKG